MAVSRRRQTDLDVRRVFPRPSGLQTDAREKSYTSPCLDQNTNAGLAACLEGHCSRLQSVAPACTTGTWSSVLGGQKTNFVTQHGTTNVFQRLQEKQVQRDPGGRTPGPPAPAACDSVVQFLKLNAHFGFRFCSPVST